MLWQCGADVTNTALNQSVNFVREAAVGLTNVYWKVAVNFKLTLYEKEIEIVKADFATVKDLAHPTPLIEKVHQIQKVVNTLESVMTNL
jgi:hypothetical protein